MTATHYKIGGSIVTLVFGDLLHKELEALHGHKSYERVCPWTTVVVVGCRYGQVCTGTVVVVIE